MRLTADLVHHSAQYLNAVKEFHLDLRGYKILFVENLSATNDQFGCIDLTDNQITKIPELPPLRNLRTLLLSNNRISKITPEFCRHTPYLENIVLTTNKVTNRDHQVDY